MEPDPLLVTPEEIHAFVRRAREVLRAVAHAEEGLSWEDRTARDELSERAHAADRLLTFCIEAAGWTRSASMLPFLAGRRTDEDDDLLEDEGGASQGESIANAVGQILKAGALVTPALAQLARSRSMLVRYEIAKHLHPTSDAAIAILERLATSDEWDAVRKAARERLVGRREFAWWHGKFSRDPVVGLDVAEAERLRAPLEIVARILDLSTFARTDHLGELADTISALPDALALDVLATVLAEPDRYYLRREPRLLAHVLERDPGGSALVQTLERWARGGSSNYDVRDLAKAAAAVLPSPIRRSAARRLLDEAEARGAGDRSDPCALLCAAAMSMLWPADEDPTPVLDAVLAVPADGPLDDLTMGYGDLFLREDLEVGPVLPRLVSACLSGFPPPWGRSGWWSSMLGRAPASVLRDTAMRALDGGSDRDTLAWALVTRIGRGHDPERDPAPVEILRSAWSEPRLRDAILESSSLRSRALPLAREDLRAGLLDFRRAEVVLRSVGELWGGVAPMRFGQESDEELARSRAEKGAVVEPFLGAEEHRGPPTEREWEIYRALRDRTLATSRDRDDWHLALRTLPEGGLAPDDRALFPRALELLREGADLLFALAWAMAASPDPEWLPLMEELTGVNAEETSDPRAQLHAALGVLSSPPSASAAPAGAPTANLEWMDEPDD